MTRCQVCGSTSGFQYTCSSCSDQYCIEHIDTAAHDCDAREAEHGQTTDLRRIGLALVFFVAVIGSLGGFVWTFGSAESILGLEDGEPGVATTGSPAPERQVLQETNDVRTAAAASSVGYYGPLAELAADRSWSSGGSPESAEMRAVGEVECDSIATLVYNGSGQPVVSETIAEEAVAAWQSDVREREVLLADRWDLGGTAVEETDGGVWVRLVLCNSTGAGTAEPTG